MWITNTVYISIFKIFSISIWIMNNTTSWFEYLYKLFQTLTYCKSINNLYFLLFELHISHNRIN